jgi:hypothetical protein
MIMIFFERLMSQLHDSESGDDTRNCFLLTGLAGLDCE